MRDIALVMPMAGRGSRFKKESVPKPLIELCGRPFFFWAVESLRRSVSLRSMVFAVLEEHVRVHAIDAVIRQIYPAAQIVTVSDVTGGSAETAALALRALDDDGPVAINDCDHAFDAFGIEPHLDTLLADAKGLIVGFDSDNPAYSYVRFGPDGHVAGTVEKRPVSQSAIAGCYFMESPGTFLQYFEEYRRQCAYSEFFTSGIYDLMARDGARIGYHKLRRHLSFGTPEEVERLDDAALAFLRSAMGSA